MSPATPPIGGTGDKPRPSTSENTGMRPFLFSLLRASLFSESIESCTLPPPSSHYSQRRVGSFLHRSSRSGPSKSCPMSLALSLPKFETPEPRSFAPRFVGYVWGMRLESFPSPNPAGPSLIPETFIPLAQEPELPIQGFRPLFFHPKDHLLRFLSTRIVVRNGSVSRKSPPFLLCTILFRFMLLHCCSMLSFHYAHQALPNDSLRSVKPFIVFLIFPRMPGVLRRPAHSVLVIFSLHVENVETMRSFSRIKLHYAHSSTSKFPDACRSSSKGLSSFSSSLLWSWGSIFDALCSYNFHA